MGTKTSTGSDREPTMNDVMKLEREAFATLQINKVVIKTAILALQRVRGSHNGQFYIKSCKIIITGPKSVSMF